MTTVAKILNNIAHRPWPLPAGQWQYYQEWNNALFLHWSVPVEMLKPLIPDSLHLDLHDGKAWVSVVAFKMEKIRPKGLPTIPFVSDFYEVNVRTYVTKDRKPGVYFLNIEAQKTISAFIARKLSGLPYEKSSILTSSVGDTISFKSSNKLKGFKLEADYQVKENIAGKSILDYWLTERYCLYLEEKSSLYRYEIHHDEWEINSVNIKRLDIDYGIAGLAIKSTKPALIHYSKGVQVLAWGRKSC